MQIYPLLNECPFLSYCLLRYIQVYITGNGGTRFCNRKAVTHYLTGNGGTRFCNRKAVTHYLSMDYFAYQQKIIRTHSDGKLQIGKT